MTEQDAIRIMKTAEKHCGAAADLGVELIRMVADGFRESMLRYDCQIEQLHRINEDLQHQVDMAVDHAASVDCTVELEEAKQEIEALKKKLAVKLEAPAPKKRPGRPKKEKTEDAEGVHALAMELANMKD